MPEIHNNPQRRCVGFGEFTGKCPEMAGTPWTDFWCPRCDELRRAHIDKRFAAIQQQLTQPGDGK